MGSHFKNFIVLKRKIDPSHLKFFNESLKVITSIGSRLIQCLGIIGLVGDHTSPPWLVQGRNQSVFPAILTATGSGQIKNLFTKQGWLPQAPNTLGHCGLAQILDLLHGGQAIAPFLSWANEVSALTRAQTMTIQNEPSFYLYRILAWSTGPTII